MIMNVRLATVVGLASVVGSVQAQLLAVEWGSRNLYGLNPLTASKFLVGPTGIGSDLAGLESHPDGRVFATTVFTGTSPNQLFRVNPTSGVGFGVGPLGIGDIAEGAVAFSPTGVGYGMEQITGGVLGLFRFDPDTGTGTVVGNVGKDINGLAWRSDGLLLGVGNLSGLAELNLIMPGSGAIVGTHLLSFSGGSVGGMASRPNRFSGWLMTGGTGTNSLYSLNFYTGSTTLIGSLGLAGTGGSGLTFRGPVQQDLLGINWDTGGLYRVNTNTAGLIPLGTTGILSMGALELAPDGELYGISSGASASLYRIDPVTSSTTFIGPLGVGFIFEGGLAFEPDMSAAYAVNQNSSGDAYLLRVNLNTGAGTIVGTMGARDVNGLMLRSDGRLIAIDRVSNSILIINKLTGAVIGTVAPIATTVANLGGVTSDAWHYGYWFANGSSVAPPNQLYFVNAFTGASSLIGTMPIAGAGISGLAINPRLINGTMMFQNLDSSAASPTSVEIEIRIPETLVGLWTKKLTLSTSGVYRLSAPEVPGEYGYSIKHRHWLRRTRVVDSTFGNVSGVNWSFINGDADPDNEVNLVDYATVSAAFGSVSGEANWNPMADLDEDGEITLVDVSIVSGNFGLIGDD